MADTDNAIFTRLHHQIKRWLKSIFKIGPPKFWSGPPNIFPRSLEVPYPIKPGYNTVHGTFCFSNSISWIWVANWRFSCFIKMSTMQVSTFEVFNIQVHIFGFIWHPSTIHCERKLRVQLISTPIPTVSVAKSPPVVLLHDSHMFVFSTWWFLGFKLSGFQNK